MCAFRIASLFTRNAVTKTPEPTKTKPVRNKNAIQEKVTAASDYVSGQLDRESTKNIKSEAKKRPLPNNLGTKSAKLNTAYQVNPNDSKSSQSEAPISEKNSTPEKSEDTIESRSDPEAYRMFLKNIPEKGIILGNTYGLNECEMAAIRCYTGKDYRVINSTLRALTGTDVDFYKANSLKYFGVSEHLSEIISDLANGMRKLPPARNDSQSSFGLGRDVTLEGDALKRMKEGEIISDLMFTSTTTTLEQVADGNWWHKNDQVLIIHQRVDGNGRDIAAFSGYSESEILFLPGTKFIITYRNDNAIVGSGGEWGPIYKQLSDAFFDAFPKKYVDQLDYDFVLINDALGETYPLNFKAAADLMDKKFPGIFFIKSATNEKDEGTGKITIDLENLYSLSRKLHAEEYGGAIKPGTEMNKIVITMEELSPDDELRINLEKSQVTSGKKMTSAVPFSTPHTSTGGQNNVSGKMPLEKPNTKSDKTEEKIPVRDQTKMSANPNTATKPSNTNKSNFRNDDYSPSDASNYGEYFPGFRE